LTNPPLPKNFRRNFWCLIMDFGFFGVAMAFFSSNTIIPSFLTELGASSTVVGFMATLQRACWLTPQLFAARYMANKPYKKPYILWPAAIGRSLLLVLAGIVWGTQGRSPELLIPIAAVIIAVFWIADGLASLSWFDLLSKAIPPTRRGRMSGIGQTLSGILSFLAGFAVEWILSDRGVPFPNNYALLFVIAFVMLAGSYLGIFLLIESKGTATKDVPTWQEYLPQLWGLLKNNHTFRTYTIVRQIFNLNMLATPFYMTYALDVIGLPSHVAGRYTSIGVVGGILASLLFGMLNERYGTKSAIQASIWITAAVPVLAILVPQLVTNVTWLAWAYGLVFFALNASMSSFLPGWTAFVLELAPEAERPAYVGLNNTINGVATLFTTLGGLILQWSGNNYNLLFVIAALGTLAALPVALRMRDPRESE